MQAHKDNGLSDFSEVMPGAWELAGPGGSLTTYEIISVFLVSCCTAVPTKISGSVLMDRMRLPNKNPTCMAVILASCCINLSAKEMTKMILNSSSYICSHLR